MTQADHDEDSRPGPISDEAAETRELRRRVRVLEQENEVLRRAAAYLS
jgi:transposase-like protein